MPDLVTSPADTMTHSTYHRLGFSLPEQMRTECDQPVDRVLAYTITDALAPTCPVCNAKCPACASMPFEYRGPKGHLALDPVTGATVLEPHDPPTEEAARRRALIERTAHEAAEQPHEPA